MGQEVGKEAGQGVAQEAQFVVCCHLSVVFGFGLVWFGLLTMIYCSVGYGLLSFSLPISLQKSLQ